MAACWSLHLDHLPRLEHLSLGEPKRQRPNAVTTEGGVGWAVRMPIVGHPAEWYDILDNLKEVNHVFIVGGLKISAPTTSKNG